MNDQPDNLRLKGIDWGLFPSESIYDPLIPPLPSALIERNRDLTQIRKCLYKTVETFVLKGLPGVGKTTLAVILAHDPQVLEAFPDGILWVIWSSSRANGNDKY